MLSGIWSRLKENIGLATAGGGWSKAIDDGTRRNLRWFFLDGVVGASLDGIVSPFFTLFLLALGATNGQIGLMTSLAGLNATLMLLPGAILSERTGKRKLIFVLCGAGFARFTILLTALLPFFLPWPTAIYVIMGMKVIADGLGNFSGPAWTSLAGDIVPMAWRGRYFGSRNFFMAISTMAATFLVGNLISHFDSIRGYQIGWIIAFCAGMISTLLFFQIKEPHLPRLDTEKAGFIFKSLLDTLSADGVLRRYILFGILWNLSIGFTSPYFVIYMVSNLKATPSEVAVFTIAGSLAGLPALRLFGRLLDSWGSKKVQMVTGFLMSSLPFFWIIAKAPIHGTLINIPGGIVWAGFNLASFNFLLSLASSQQRARYAALFQLAAYFSSAVGTLVGTLVVSKWGYNAIFIMTGTGLFLAILFFTRAVNPETQPVNS